jgi:DNA-binding CsgD family transcriptional regulator
MGTAWPLVGRQEELELIARVMEGHECEGVVLAGASGVGKSRLAAEAMSVARDRGWATVGAIATRAAASIPFGALAHLLPAPGVSSGDRLRLLSQLQRTLVDHAAGRRLAVLVDDAHLLDDGSAALILQLAASQAAFVLLTIRTGAGSPEPLVSLWKEGLVTRLEVRALSEHEVSDLVARVVNGHVDGATLHELARVTSGNVLFLRELIHCGMASGALACAEGVWRWRGAMAPSGALLSVIKGRLDLLDRDERRVLETIALGEPLGADLLRPAGSAETFTRAEADGLLTASEEGRRAYLRLAHPLYGEALRADTGPLRARDISRRLADALELTGCRRRDDLLRLATWRLDAGERPATEMLAAAAARALSAGDLHLAERLARTAVDTGDGFTSRFVLGQALMGQQRPIEAEGMFVSAVAPSDKMAVRLAIVRAANLYWGLGRIAEADQVLAAAPESRVDPPLRDALKVTRAFSLLCLGKPRDALAMASAVIDSGKPTGAAGVFAVNVTAICHAAMGRPERALAAIGRGVQALEGQHGGAIIGQPQLRLIEWYALLLAGRLDECDGVAQAEYRQSVLVRSDRERAMFSFQLGVGALVRGRVRSGLGWLQEATVLSREHDPARILVVSLASMAEAAALAGELTRAETILRDPGLLPSSVLPYEEAWVTLSRAWVIALAGGIARARSAAQEAADIAAGQGFGALEVLALHSVARLGDPHAVASRLGAVVAGLDGAMFPTMARHAAALAARSGPCLDDAAGGFLAIGAYLWAAEASADAAREHERASHLTLARASHARARRLAAQCEGAVTPALGRVAPPGSLTPREQEIAHLAVMGLSSREIAGRLTLATRTVENTLQRVYSKLDVSTRQELASVLRPPAPNA